MYISANEFCDRVKLSDQGINKITVSVDSGNWYVFYMTVVVH